MTYTVSSCPVAGVVDTLRTSKPLGLNLEGEPVTFPPNAHFPSWFMEYRMLPWVASRSLFRTYFSRSENN